MGKSQAQRDFGLVNRSNGVLHSAVCGEAWCARGNTEA